MTLASIFLTIAIVLVPVPSQKVRPTVQTIVVKIQRADYAADRTALEHLHAELTPFLDDREIAARVAYWRGFAMWRRALNGFNDAADRTELDEDLAQCVNDFREALVRDPAFTDAKVGAASCLVNRSFLNLKSDPTRARDLFVQSDALLKQALGEAPANPRALWVQGANQWFAPAERGGGHDVAIATYTKGLELARRLKGRGTDPLDPTWGEPELLMNLAFANLNRATPDLAAAERYAQSALALVPYWHYVRDILLPQILKAKASAQLENGSRGFAGGIRVDGWPCGLYFVTGVKCVRTQSHCPSTFRYTSVIHSSAEIRWPLKWPVFWPRAVTTATSS